jgi:DNA-directed RNA polymerase subunit RPC12/RpoP
MVSGKSWLVFGGESLIFLTIIGVSIYATGWFSIIMIMGLLAVWWHSARPAYQCPKCKKFFYRDHIRTKVINRGNVGWKSKVEHIYKCKECKHKWRHIAFISHPNLYE